MQAGQPKIDELTLDDEEVSSGTHRFLLLSLLVVTHFVLSQQSASVLQNTLQLELEDLLETLQVFLAGTALQS
jgi:hypothetical protein